MNLFKVLVSVVMVYSAWKMSNYYKTLAAQLPAPANSVDRFRKMLLTLQFTVSVVTLLFVAIAVHKSDGVFG